MVERAGNMFVGKGTLLLCDIQPSWLCWERREQTGGNPEDNSKQKQEVKKCLLQWKDEIICFL